MNFYPERVIDQPSMRNFEALTRELREEIRRAISSENRVFNITNSIIGGPGVIDHGLTGGLLDDDHSQYYNQARGDARYSQISHGHYSLYASDGTPDPALYCDSAGNVGIGTSSPTQRVHIAGSIRMVDGNQAIDRIMRSDANGVGAWYGFSTLADPWLAGKEEQNAPSVMAVDYGTLDAGTVADLAAVGGTDVQISEATGVNALQVTFTFASVDLDPNQLLIYGNYNGSTAHQLAAEIYNYGTASWDQLGLITHSTTKAWYAFSIYQGSNYRNAGAAQVRLRHLQSGNPAHDLILDYVSLKHNLTTGGGVGNYDHGQLTGLLDNDHTQYSLTTHEHIRATNFSLFGITEDCYISTGDSPWTVPESIAGWNLVAVTCSVKVKGVGGTMTAQVIRHRAGVSSNMLSSELSIGDAYFSNTCAINGSYDDLAHGDIITIDVTGIHSSAAAKGLGIVLTFAKP